MLVSLPFLHPISVSPEKLPISPQEGYFGLMQVSGDVPTLYWVRSGVRLGTGLGLALALKRGEGGYFPRIPN